MLYNLNIVEETNSPQLLTDDEIQSLTELGIDLSPVLSNNEINTEINNSNNTAIFEEAEIDTTVELNYYVPDIYKEDIVALTDKFKNLKWILNSLELLYSQRYDYVITHIDVANTIMLQIYIYYPSIEISNGTETHIINKLLVNINMQIDCNEIIFFSIEGTRLELSYEEAAAGYFHSHLPIRHLDSHNITESYFSAFCIGNGIYDRYKLNRPIVTSTDTDIDAHILSFFAAVDSALAWESLSGGPYVKMSNIKVRALAEIPIIENIYASLNMEDIIIETTSTFIKTLLTKLDIDILTSDDIPINLVIKNYHSLVHDQELVELAKSFNTQLLAVYKDLCYYFFGNILIDLVYNKRYIINNLTFRNKKVTRVVTPASTQDTITYCINPAKLRKVIEYVVFKFSNYLYYKYY